MHYKKHSPSTSPASASPDATPRHLHRFDALDWIAAAFVITTPVFIAFRLFWN